MRELGGSVVSATDIGTYAMEYAANNWQVFPLRGKIPAIAGGRGVLDATSDLATVAHWWGGRYSGCNIGARIPEALMVIDVDPRHDGHNSLAALEAKHGSLPETLTTISGRGDGGRHLFFRRPSGKLTATRLGPGIDLKTSSGYVVMPPSIHPDSGQPYTRVDELHVVTEAVWEAVTSVTGKRPESLTLAISTPASSPDSVMWRLVEYGRSAADPAFYFTEYAAPDGCPVDDRQAWRTANPALACRDPFLSEDGLAAVLKTIREPVFRQLRLGQWVTGVESWLPWGAWEACRTDRQVDRRERVVLAFDGSASGDSTALVGCTLDGHIWLEGLWENPGDPRWRVPRDVVSNAIDAAFDRYNVAELACDPWGWRSEIEAWSQRHGERRVLEWNTAAAQRMAPATDRLYQAVLTQGMTHDGDPRLASHIAHCVAKSTPQGDLVSKDKRGSPRKIDAAVAAIVAYDRAAWHLTKTRNRTRSFTA